MAQGHKLDYEPRPKLGWFIFPSTVSMSDIQAELEYEGMTADNIINIQQTDKEYIVFFRMVT
jgi:hypothetical protein